METAHSTNFSKLVNAAKSLRTEVPSVQVSKIREKIMPSVERQVAQARGPIKKLYEKAYNNFASMADGIKSGDVGKSEYLEFVREVADLQTAAIAIESAPPKQKAEANSSRFMDSEVLLEKQAQNAQRVMQKYKAYESQVPRTIAKRFLATRVPLVALTNPVLQRDSLDKLKLLDDMVFGYPILTKQVVVGLNADWVVANYKRDVNEALEDVIDVLKGQTNKKFIVLGEPRKRGLVFWSWLVTAQDMARLNKASPQGHFALKAWSFPFEADPQVMKAPPK